MKGFPQQGQQVLVIAPSGATIGARVMGLDPGATLLDLSGTGSPVTLLAGGNVAIEYTNRRGICRIDGAAHVAGETTVRVEHDTGVRLIQRREFMRLDATVRVTYHPPGGWAVETTTVNVSGAGFQLAAGEGLCVGDIVEFTLELDGEGNKEAGPLVVTGAILREVDGGVGVKIVDVDEEERERLIRWIFVRERLALQIVRGT